MMNSNKVLNVFLPPAPDIRDTEMRLRIFDLIMKQANLTYIITEDSSTTITRQSPQSDTKLKRMNND